MYFLSGSWRRWSQKAAFILVFSFFLGNTNYSSSFDCLLTNILPSLIISPFSADASFFLLFSESVSDIFPSSFLLLYLYLCLISFTHLFFFCICICNWYLSLFFYFSVSVSVTDIFPSSFLFLYMSLYLYLLSFPLLFFYYICICVWYLSLFFSFSVSISVFVSVSMSVSDIFPSSFPFLFLHLYMIYFPLSILFLYLFLISLPLISFVCICTSFLYLSHFLSFSVSESDTFLSSFLFFFCICIWLPEEDLAGYFVIHRPEVVLKLPVEEGKPSSKWNQEQENFGILFWHRVNSFYITVCCPYFTFLVCNQLWSIGLPGSVFCVNILYMDCGIETEILLNI